MTIFSKNLINKLEKEKKYQEILNLLVQEMTIFAQIF
jgi:hypothetical protein